MEEINVGSAATGLCGRNGCKVAVDTGTSMLAAPSKVVDGLKKRLQVMTDCSNRRDLPDLSFTVGNLTLTLTPQEYVVSRGLGCRLALMALDIPPPRGPLFIFGDPLLRKYYTVYDYTNMRIGFGVAKHGLEETRKDPMKPGAAVLMPNMAGGIETTDHDDSDSEDDKDSEEDSSERDTSDDENEARPAVGSEGAEPAERADSDEDDEHTDVVLVSQQEQRPQRLRQGRAG